MGPHVITCAMLVLVLVLLLVAAGDAHHKSGHATRHGAGARAGHRARAAHRSGKATPVATKATRQAAADEPQLVTVKATNVIEFDFGDDGTLETQMIVNRRYNPRMVFAYDVTMDDRQRNRIFVTTPLMRRGTPATLTTIPFDGDETPRVKPYPNLAIHATTEDYITDCNAQLVDVISTTKTWADDDKLYALDNGALDLTTSQKIVCPPKIVVFDLRTDEIMSVTIIDSAACNSVYTSLWVDECPDGGLTAYISDTMGSMLTVTDLTTGVSKHLQSQYFHPKPGYFFIRAGGPAYYIPQGMSGVTADQSCDGKLYFQALASNIQGAVDKQVIRDASDGDVLDIKTEVALPGELSGPSGKMVVDPTGQLLFFPVMDEVAIYCWNTSKPHDPKNFRVMHQSNESMEYVSSLNIETETQRLYVLSNRFTYYLSNTTDYSELNYRILYIDIHNIEC